ncbi:MAG: CTP--2,3-di-O-geranylgeranyl-sn-glycero-1-phosphate cytidyltransferase, partial [Nanoarchaeota archaeon]|nr:CTP--2,3-di-O-geranylgeranyl-sn-glycero-1-phosphate cytidyltransferase [Nanoarchaeota archaeon]
KRKLVHVSTVVYVVIYYFISQIFSKNAALLVLVFILICLSFVEFMKIKFNLKIPFINSLYRESEKEKFSGSIYLILGMIIAFAIFDFNIALTAILMMLFGDTAAAIFGRIGKHKIAHLGVSWEGIISEFLVNVAIGLIFLSNIPVAFIMAFAATTVETLVDPIDDNLAIPVVAGFAGEALMILMRHL